jgi:prepilin signal peptidase PulO-like enzyme (type II secretory pathway)
MFLVGAAYMLVYAFVFALMNRKIIFHFKKDMKASRKMLAIGSTILFFIFFIFNLFLIQYFNLSFDFLSSLENSLLVILVTVALFVIYRFAKAVEDLGFKKKISVSKLKVGDVLLENKLYKGITEKELKQIRKNKKSVWIKEGVRFAPTFPLALLFTIHFGDGILLFIKFLL